MCVCVCVLLTLLLFTEVGDLDVYVRTGTDDQPIDVSVFHRNSYQGDDWIKGHVTIPDQQDVYRVSTDLQMY